MTKQQQSEFVEAFMASISYLRRKTWLSWPLAAAAFDNPDKETL